MEDKNLKNLSYIMEFDNAFNSDYCDYLIKRRGLSSLPPYEDIVYWKNKEIHLDWKDLCEEFDKLAEPFISTYLNQFSEVYHYGDISIEGYGLTRQPSQAYDESHYDSNIVINEKGIQIRPFVLLIYLNDCFDGGQLIFPAQKKIVTPKKGKMVIFPCSFMYPHKVLGISSGNRYSLRLNYLFKKPMIDSDVDYWDITKLGVQRHL
jgi:hypothetical protein